MTTPDEIASTIVGEMKTAGQIHREVMAWLTAAAQSQTVEVLAAQDGLLAQFTEAHELDAASFRFECRRWGDFLSLMVERGGEKTMHALGVGGGSVQLTHGHAPDRQGEVSFDYRVERLDGSHGGRRIVSYGSGYCEGLSWPDDGKFLVTPRYRSPDRPTRGLVLDAKERADYAGIGSWDRVSIPFTVPSGARIAADDVLRFERAGATLYVPAGHGDPVYAAILGELARGADDR